MERVNLRAYQWSHILSQAKSGERHIVWRIAAIFLIVFWAWVFTVIYNLVSVVF